MKFFTPFRFAALVAVLTYLFLNAYVLYQSSQYDKELAKFDLNQDGFFTKNEISQQQQVAMSNVTRDTARNFAPYTLIPVAMFLGLLVYFVVRLIKIFLR